MTGSAPRYFIGLMSGTSVDSIDAALLNCGKDQTSLKDACATEYTPSLRQQIISVASQTQSDLDHVLELDCLIGEAFSAAANTLLQRNNLPAAAITAIGSHGQTIRHHPNRATPYSLQIGNPAIIAIRTGILTVADFRSSDIAAGGQGAPITPAFHREIFHCEDTDRIILNIGGIANATLLRKDKQAEVIGFDTGPGNLLMDGWCQKFFDRPYDQDGELAKQGEIDPELLAELLRYPYFERQHPKSSGREEFNLAWFEHVLETKGFPTSKLDVVSTLSQLTVETISQPIRKLGSRFEIYVCGGGALNGELLQRLKSALPNSLVTTTKDIGLAPEWVEASALAWLAKQRVDGGKAGLPSVTGARVATVLGATYSP